ncbi:MAG: hypothetical protein N3G22_02925 [Candidatus Micrarchaeota archaeon]|nr:hypothetical protein [Candidatus Micrarchaeota archaeon]
MENERQKEAILKGEVSVRAKRAGAFQVLLLKVVRRQGPFGKVPFLVLDRHLDMAEIVRIAEEYQLPVESPVGKVFPRGKKESDFAGL